MTIKKVLSITTGIAISLFFIYLAFKNVPFTELIEYIKSINFLYFIPCVALVFLGFAARAVRWRILLLNKEDLPRLFNIMMTGFMLNCIMPGRIGEIARPVLISKNNKIGFSEALSSIAVERVFDLAMLLMFFGLLYPFISISNDLSYSFGNYILSKELLLSFVSTMTKIGLLLSLGLFFVAIEKTRKIIFISIDFFETLAMKLPEKYFNFLKTYFATILRSFINGLAAGTSSIKNPFKLMSVIILSFFAWFLQGVSYYILAKAAPGIDLNFAEITFVLVIVSFFIAIPSVPGFWGVWEAGGIFAMSVFGISKTDAAGFNLVNHALQMFPVIITGLVCAWITGFSMKSIRRKSD